MKMHTKDTKYSSENYGVLLGIMAYLVWGLLPLYWKMIKVVPAQEILAHRILWSFIFVTIVVILSGKWGKMLEVFKDKKCMGYIAICSVLISINWFLYIWAVNSKHIVDASLGYYINPLMSVLFGVIFLKEKLEASQYIALVIAAAAVVFMIVLYGSVPWISLALATSFALYGLCKKMISAESTVGLAIETSILTPLALGYLIFIGFHGNGAYGSSAGVTIFLSVAGVVTAIPLIFFAESVKRIKLSTIGFLQYLSPTLSLIIGLVVYKETFSQVDILGFGLIWVALIIYSRSLLKKSKTGKNGIAAETKV